jgi:HAE1 family hydrophobic/amphiphilic exporter-1
MFVFTLIGFYSLIQIPKESAPEVVVPVGIVTTVLRGGAGEDVEKLVTNKLEEEIVNVENIDKVTSSSQEGVSVITAQFNASADIEKSIQDLKDAVDKVKTKLPTDADEPTVTKVNFSQQPILILSISQDLSPAGLTRLGDDLEKELRKVKGVSQVDILGTRKKQVQVVLRKDKLATYGVSINQVIAAISGANASFPIGSITVADVDYPIKFSGSIDEANQVPDITLTSPSGSVIYLRDIAFVADGLEAPKTFSRISVDGQPSQNALTLNVYKKTGGDVTEIGQAVKEKIESLKSSMLLNANVVVSFDGGDQVTKDLRELTRVGLETVVLVMIVLFLTIGWRESVVAGLSIPLSFVIAFIGLYASGNTINFISLFSLILAIGILVDSGIVVAEGIHTRIKLYGNVEDATIATIREYAWPLIAGTMTTVAVFAPLFFLSGVVGQFISSIPFTIIFVLIASIFVALGMVPLLATVLTKDSTGHNAFVELQEKWFLKIKTWYMGFLGSILRNRSTQNKFFLGLIIAFFVALALPISGLLKVQFFPQDDQGLLFVTIEKPQGTPLVETDLVVRQIEEILYDEEYVTSFVTTVGAGSAFVGDGNTGAATKIANITVLLTDKNDRDKDSTEIMDKIRKDLSPINEADVKVDQGNNGPPSGAPVTITFKGDNLEALSLLVSKAETILKGIPGTRDVETSLRDDGTQFEITIDRAKASQSGLSATQVAQVLRASIAGTTATTIKKQGEDIDVLVKVDLNANFINPEDTIKTTLDTIKQLSVVTPTGTVLLGSFISTKVSESRSVISHKDNKRIASVNSQLTDGATALEVVALFKKQEASLGIPAGIEIDYGGENEDVQTTFKEMILALLAGMAGMLAILVLEFNSFRYAFYLLFTIPLSLIGVLGGLTITGQTLSFSSMLGLIALAGVIINHAIILLDSILHRLAHEKEQEKPATLHDVIVESSSIRLRPIVLTTVTTVVGMIPLAGVSALWGPLAFAIMFGLTFAMVLTLILIPVFFYRYPGKAYESMKDDSTK